MANRIKETDITRAIAKGFFDDFLEYIESDVVIVGGGPSGTVAGMLLAREGVKTLILEKDRKPGGGMWQGGMLFPKLVVETPVDLFLDNFGIKTTRTPEGLFVADSYYITAKLLALAFDNGAKMFNSVRLQDVVYNETGVTGVVINWDQVAHLTAECVDPLTLGAKVVIDCTGHNADVVKVVAEKIGIPGLKKPFVGREGSMWVDESERTLLENTREVFPGLIVAGMAANSVQGMPRPGPIFGGMFLSGIKAAKLALEKLNKDGKFHKNHISKEVLAAVSV